MGAFVVVAALMSGASLADDLPFNVAIPVGVIVQKTDGPDATVYYFNKNGITYAGVYVGNFPEFGDLTLSDAVQQAVECKNHRAAKRDVLLRIGNAGSDAEYLHAWIFEDNGQRDLARGILTSIRVPGKNEGVRVADLAPCPR
jgi:hypothetical protein